MKDLRNRFMIAWVAFFIGMPTSWGAAAKENLVIQKYCLFNGRGKGVLHISGGQYEKQVCEHTILFLTFTSAEVCSYDFGYSANNLCARALGIDEKNKKGFGDHFSFSYIKKKNPKKKSVGYFVPDRLIGLSESKDIDGFCPPPSFFGGEDPEKKYVDEIEWGFQSTVKDFFTYKFLFHEIVLYIMFTETPIRKEEIRRKLKIHLHYLFGGQYEEVNGRVRIILDCAMANPKAEPKVWVDDLLRGFPLDYKVETTKWEGHKGQYLLSEPLYNQDHSAIVNNLYRDGFPDAVEFLSALTAQIIKYIQTTGPIDPKIFEIEPENDSYDAILEIPSPLKYSPPQSKGGTKKPKAIISSPSSGIKSEKSPMSDRAPLLSEPSVKVNKPKSISYLSSTEEESEESLVSSQRPTPREPSASFWTLLTWKQKLGGTIVALVGASGLALWLYKWFEKSPKKVKKQATEKKVPEKSLQQTTLQSTSSKVKKKRRRKGEASYA